jgi:hypothetical protein
MGFIVHDTVAAMAELLRQPLDRRPDALREAASASTPTTRATSTPSSGWPAPTCSGRSNGS